MSFYRISQKEVDLAHDFTSSIIFLVALPKHHVLLIFENNNYTLWDVCKNV